MPLSLSLKRETSERLSCCCPMDLKRAGIAAEANSLTKIERRMRWNRV